MENATPSSEQSAKTLTTIIYALYAASLLVGITAIVAIVMNYVKKDDVAGTFLESHFRWQIRTFWWSLLFSVIGVLTLRYQIGWAIVTLTLIWYIYRAIKGWVRLSSDRAVDDPTAWF